MGHVNKGKLTGGLILLVIYVGLHILLDLYWGVLGMDEWVVFIGWTVLSLASLLCLGLILKMIFDSL